MPSLTVENYVKTISLIAARDRRAASRWRPASWPQALNVSPGTVTGMLKTLSEATSPPTRPTRGRGSPPSGQRLAMKVIRRHRLLELFLVQTLDMPWDEVHEEAEHMEHAASERLIDRIDAFLGHPAVDPHGDPIPGPTARSPRPRGRRWPSSPAGQRFRVVRVVDQDPAFLRYLTECGLDLHATGRARREPPRGRRPGLPDPRPDRRPRARRRGEGAGRRGRVIVYRSTPHRQP